MSSQIISELVHHLLDLIFATLQRPKIQNGLELIGLAYTVKFLLQKVFLVGNTIRVYVLPRIFERKINWRKFGKWAVVTGSTDGIGKEFARQLASHGLNIVLISRSSEKLEKVADEISQEYSIQVKTIPLNFSEATLTVYKKLEENLLEIGADEIGVLVNNVGAFIEYPMPLGQMSERTLWDHFTVNCGAATMMTRILLPKMKERGKGGIINVSSASAFRPLPMCSTYSASKIYVDYLSEAVRLEYKENGITVLNLNPVYMATSMTQSNKEISTPGFFIPTAKQYAESAIKTFGLVDKTPGYFPHAIQLGILSLIPKWIRKRMEDKHLKAWKRQAEEEAQEKLTPSRS